MDRWRRIGGAVALSMLLGGCGGAPAAGGPVGPGSNEARALHAHACARCHAPPEPMKHTRAELEAIFVRHRTRAKLTGDQWQSMVVLLARPDETPGPR